MHQYGCKRVHPRCEPGVVLLMSHIFDGGKHSGLNRYESVPISDHRQQTMLTYKKNNRTLFCTLFDVLRKKAGLQTYTADDSIC